MAAATIAALHEARHPPDLPEDEALVLAFSVELHLHRSVSDTTWAHALRVFGEQGVVDLMGIHGDYTLLAMVMNASRTSVPGSPAPALRPLPDLHG